MVLTFQVQREFIHDNGATFANSIQIVENCRQQGLQTVGIFFSIVQKLAIQLQVNKKFTQFDKCWLILDCSRPWIAYKADIKHELIPFVFLILKHHGIATNFLVQNIDSERCAV